VCTVVTSLARDAHACCNRGSIHLWRCVSADTSARSNTQQHTCADADPCRALRHRTHQQALAARS
jgi:hypothetical protein